MLNLPNFLTLLRILTIPVFLEFLSYHFYWEALVVFAIGGLTDFLDGFVARWMKQQTALGAYLDPVADKLLVITSFIMLGSIGGHSPVARDCRRGPRCSDPGGLRDYLLSDRRAAASEADGRG